MDVKLKNLAKARKISKNFIGTTMDSYAIAELETQIIKLIEKIKNG